MARYVVDAVVVEGRSYREVAGAHGVSKSWVAKLVARYRSGGYEALAPRSKAARRIPHRTKDETEDNIVRLRKELTERGFDGGACTIHYHLGLSDPSPPSVATIWRVLK
ncbi:MAG: helix-turn-helix domain-containing protein, partial [Actinomycetota bacterium]